jgi:hypothetical protein
MHEQAYFLLAPLSPIRVTSDVDATRLTRLKSLTMLLEALVGPLGPESLANPLKPAKEIYLASLAPIAACVLWRSVWRILR